MVNILGIDLGVKHLGVALIEAPPGRPMRLLQTATMGVALKTKPDQFVHYFWPRLQPYMRNADCIGAESLTWFSKRQQGQQRRGGAPATELWVKLGSIHGMLTAMARGFEIEYRSIQPPALKQIVTGARKGGKEPMIEMAKHLFPDFDGDNHAADAILAGLACWQPERITLGSGAAPQ
jgi:Holliday junction resolvasome RuvABC endonuclease subunit